MGNATTALLEVEGTILFIRMLFGTLELQFLSPQFRDQNSRLQHYSNFQPNSNEISRMNEIRERIDGLFSCFLSSFVAAREFQLSAYSVPGGGVLGLRTYGDVPLENLKSYPVPEPNSRK